MTPLSGLINPGIEFGWDENLETVTHMSTVANARLEWLVVDRWFRFLLLEPGHRRNASPVAGDFNPESITQSGMRLPVSETY